MAILDLNIDQDFQLKILPDGTEAELSIKYADIVPKKNKPNEDNLALVFEYLQDPMVDDIRVWLPIPTDEQRQNSPKDFLRAQERITSFLSAFGLSMPISTDDMVGRTGWALISEGENQNGEPSNSVRRFIAAR